MVRTEGSFFCVWDLVGCCLVQQPPFLPELESPLLCGSGSAQGGPDAPHRLKTW